MILFFTFGNLILISLNSKIYVKTNNKRMEYENCLAKRSLKASSKRKNLRFFTKKGRIWVFLDGSLKKVLS